MRSAFGAFSLFTYSMTLIPSFFSSSHLSSLSDPFPLNFNPSFVVSLPTLSLYPRSPSLPLSHYPHSFLSLSYLVNVGISLGMNGGNFGFVCVQVENFYPSLIVWKKPGPRENYCVFFLRERLMWMGRRRSCLLIDRKRGSFSFLITKFCSPFLRCRWISKLCVHR